MKSNYFFVFLLLLLVLVSCEKEQVEEPAINLLSTTANGLPLMNGASNVPVSVSIELTFSARISASSFEQAFSLSAGGLSVSGLTFQYVNAASKAVIKATLEENTEYQLRLERSAIGQNGEVLERELLLQFTTVDGGPITEQEPCLSASENCYHQFTVRLGNEEGRFHFYSSFPLDQDNTRWENLKNAVIVLHGQNRNADDYFSYMASALRSSNLEDQTVLIAPFFKDDDDAGQEDLFWGATASWREGQLSRGAAAISSFTVIDQMIDLLADKEHFPVLEKILVTGHSSGALLTHAYAAANQAENSYTDLAFYYGVANSQYFYYPRDVRWNASAQQFEEVTNCLSFNHWPLGYVNPPVYLDGVTKAAIDDQFLNRKITYFLGTDDVVTTGTLNTSDCGAVLLGENRFKRGENMFRLLTTFYAATHQHARINVNGVGHDGRAMFQSTAFINWISGIF